VYLSYTEYFFIAAHTGKYDCLQEPVWQRFACRNNRTGDTCDTVQHRGGGGILQI
jgi:hypothetical protein